MPETPFAAKHGHKTRKQRRSAGGNVQAEQSADGKSRSREAEKYSGKEHGEAVEWEIEEAASNLMRPIASDNLL